MNNYLNFEFILPLFIVYIFRSFLS